MTTISVVTALYGEQYAQYLNRWWESVKNLQRQPNEIVLATPIGNDYGLLESVPAQYRNIIIHVEANSDTVHGPWYAGLEAASSDWIFGLGIDDQFSPEAFNEVEQADSNGAELLIDKIQYLQGGSWDANWQPDRFGDRAFAPAGVAGYRKELKHYWTLMPANLRWNDHAFYILCAKNNVKVYRANTTRMVHDLGHNHVTISGVRRDSGADAEASRQIAEFIQSLGL